jgi:hypothetical protein
MSFATDYTDWQGLIRENPWNLWQNAVITYANGK